MNYMVRRTRSVIFGRCTIFLTTQIRLDSNHPRNSTTCPSTASDAYFEPIYPSVIQLRLDLTPPKQPDSNGDFFRVTDDFGINGGLIDALGECS